MPAEGTPLGGEVMREYLGEVADRLGDDGPKHVLIVVGGALLAMHDLRDTTRDIDSISPLEQELRDAIAEVAERHDLRIDWLNDRARGFTPATFRVDECGLLFERGRLTVLGAPLDQVFVMKLYRNEPQDFEDMVRIWPLCGFASPQAAVDAFFEAYPHAPADEHLIALVSQIASASEQDETA